MKVQLSQKFLRCTLFLMAGTAISAAQNAGKAPVVSQPQSLAVDRGAVPQEWYGGQEAVREVAGEPAA